MRCDASLNFYTKEQVLKYVNKSDNETMNSRPIKALKLLVKSLYVSSCHWRNLMWFLFLLPVPSYSTHEPQVTLAVDGDRWMGFHCSPRVASMLQGLRKAVENMVSQNITARTSASMFNHQTDLIEAVCELLNTAQEPYRADPSWCLTDQNAADKRLSWYDPDYEGCLEIKMKHASISNW